MLVSVTELNVYPVKSCAGIKLKRGEIGARGFRHDRSWMVLGDDDRFITQRDCSLLAHIRPSVDQSGGLSLSAPGMPDIKVLTRERGRRLEVKVWSSVCQAEEEGEEVAQWLSQFLKRSCKLVIMPEDFERIASAPKDPSKKGLAGFVDAYPFLLISAESLNDLNNRVDAPLLMNRFRPNIVVSGAKPYAEDNWKRIRIGDVVFTGVENCGRCVVTTIDQSTLERGKEPLAVLSGYRKFTDHAMFGQYLIHDNQGSIAVGDEVTILE